MMDPKYLYCLTCSIYELLIFKFSILRSSLARLRYFVFFSFIVSLTPSELFFSCWNVSISDCLVRAVINISSASHSTTVTNICPALHLNITISTYEFMCLEVGEFLNQHPPE